MRQIEFVGDYVVNLFPGKVKLIMACHYVFIQNKILHLALLLNLFPY